MHYKIKFFVLIFLNLFKFEVNLQFTDNDQPIIIGKNEYLISKNDILTLDCFGKQALHWNYTISKQSKLEIVFNASYIKELETHFSQITFKNISGVDTGLYTCSFLSNPASKSSVYLYVKDNDFLLVPASNSITIKTAILGQQLFFPCQPTDPSINVTLRKGSSKNVAGNLVYDPRRGFTIQYVTSFHNGEFRCVAEVGVKKQEIKFQINFKTNEMPAPPYFQVWHSNVRNEDLMTPITNVIQGSDVTIGCLARVPIASQSILQWNILKPDLDRFFVTNTSLMDSSSTDYNILMNNITIRNVHISDHAIYTCKIIVAAGQTSEAQISLNVIVDSKLNVRPYEKEVNAREGDAYVNFSATIYSNMPHHLALLWIQDNQPIFHGNKYQISNRPSDEHQSVSILLSILNPIVSDAGLYKLEATLEDKKIEIIFLLNILENIKIKINLPQNSNEFVTFNTISLIYCQVTGFPLPEVKWYYQDCELFPCTIKDEIGMALPSNLHNIIEEKTNRVLISTLQVTVTNSQIFICSIDDTNKNREYIILYPSDIINGFGILNKKELENTAVNDNMIVKCISQRTAFSKPTLYRLFEGTENEVENSTGVIVSNNMSDFSNIFVANFSKVKFEEFKLRCRVQYANKDFYDDIFIQINNETALPLGNASEKGQILIALLIIFLLFLIAILSVLLYKKEKSTDCDSALIPLLCVHG